MSSATMKPFIHFSFILRCYENVIFFVLADSCALIMRPRFCICIITSEIVHLKLVDMCTLGQQHMECSPINLDLVSKALCSWHSTYNHFFHAFSCFQPLQQHMAHMGSNLYREESRGGFQNPYNYDPFGVEILIGFVEI